MTLAEMQTRQAWQRAHRADRPRLNREANRLHAHLRRLLGDEWFEENPSPMRVTATERGLAALIVGELLFAFDPDVGGILVGRKTPDGSQLGYVSRDGQFLWGHQPKPMLIFNVSAN